MVKPVSIDLGFKINFKKLWALDLSVEEIDLKSLSNNLDIPYLEREGTDDWNLTPRELVKNFGKEVTHARKVNRAKLSFPIDICYFKGQWIILDGVHRYTKALMAGEATIKVRRVPAVLLDDIKRKQKK